VTESRSGCLVALLAVFASALTVVLVAYGLLELARGFA
jgi:hypothetical protein